MASVMLPKPKRLRDKRAIEAARKPYCELCGRADMGLQVHHVVSRGSGGPDMPENLITFCASCHTLAHGGCISRDELWRVIAQREGTSPMEVEVLTLLAKRRAHSG